MTFWTLLCNFMIMLALHLLRKWTIIQLSVLIVLNVITTLISLPKNVFKSAANKIVVIGTEVGFIIVAILFIVMYSLENSGSYQVRLGLSWTTIGVNVSIILFQIIVKIVEFIQLRRKKKREEQKLKLESQTPANDDGQIQLGRPHKFNISIEADSRSYLNRFRNSNDTVRF